MPQVGDYLNDWYQCSALDGEVGRTRHLVFGVVIGGGTDSAWMDADTPTACGIALGVENHWHHSDAPKCARCSQVAVGDGPAAHVSRPREEELVPA